MHYTAIDSLKNAWVFKHKSLPISEADLKKIKPMKEERSQVVWDTFISHNVDHPDFFTTSDWANKKVWQLTDNWEKRWDSETPDLPEAILAGIQWDLNTVVYFCVNRSLVIETTWKVFQQHWKNFLFMDDGSLLIGKKRKEALQFFSNGSFKLGNRT